MSALRALCGRSGCLFLAFSICIGFAVPAVAQTISAQGLSAPGSISYDALGTPTIRGANDNDVAFLQGYAQAKARFFEMDFDRRAASGTLAELVGTNALASDVQTRTLGLRRAAWATWSALDADTRGWLKAYTDGVNFWLQTQSLPPKDVNRGVGLRHFVLGPGKLPNPVELRWRLDDFDVHIAGPCDPLALRNALVSRDLDTSQDLIGLERDQPAVVEAIHREFERRRAAVEAEDVRWGGHALG
jgi:hypothetical protein